MPESFFSWVVFLFGEYWPLFLQGAVSTMLIALIGTVVGFLIGLMVGIIRTARTQRASGISHIALKGLQWLMSAYVEVFRGTPMIVQAMVVYYGAMQYLGLDIPAMTAALLVVSVNTGAYMAEIVRGGILAVPVGQKEAAAAVGMSHWQSMTGVILPQAIRSILPAVGNELVVNIKDSSVLNVISVTELYFTAKSAAGTYFRYFEVFFITAVIYFVLTFTTTRLLRLAEKKLSGSDGYTVYGSQTNPASHINVPPTEEKIG